MKIGQISQINFKGTNEVKETKPITEQVVDTPNLERPSAELLKAYSIPNVLLKDLKGIENAAVQPDYDGNQLVYTIKAPLSNTQKVKFVYQLATDESPREAFSSPKDKTGSFEVYIPVLNRKTNSIVPKFTIKSVEYFDETNLKIGEELPENMVIKPQDLMKTKENRIAIINGKPAVGEFDAISEGTSYGKLVKMDYSDVIRYKDSEPIIAVISEKDTNEMFLQISDGTFSLPMNVKGILLSPKNYKQGGMLTDCLGHAVSRLRGRKIFALLDKQTLQGIEENFYNNSENPYIKMELGIDKMKVSGLKELPKADKTQVNIPKYELVNELLTSEDDRFSPETVGLKAYNLGRLKSLQQNGGYIVPKFFVVPAGVWDYAKKSSENESIYGEKTDDASKLGEYHYYSQKADASDKPEFELKGIRRLVSNDMIIPKDVREKLKEKAETIFNLVEMANNEGCLIARSSFNGEDSPAIATQGLYDSFPGIRTDENLFRGIKEVWASKWSDLAYMSRRNHNIPHSAIQPNVIVQEVVPVDYTFTINTADPRQNNKNKIVCQLSQGVYSGFPNSPYIFEYDKTTGEVLRKTLATKKRTKPIEKIKMDDYANLEYDQTDYSKDPLNMSKKQYVPIMQKVFDVANFIENKFGGVPQDIEGGIIFKRNEETGEMYPEIHIWQTRDVHLLKR